MRLHLAFIIALLLVISGCAKTDPSCASPSIPFEEGCCLDINRNGACDRIENSPEAEAAAEETVEEEAVSEESVRTVSPTIPLATVIPVIGTGGKETKDTTKWESIKLYYQDSIGRCGGSTIQFSSFDSASDSIFLKIAGGSETITKGDIGYAIQTRMLDYVVRDFEIFFGADQGMSYVSLKINCK